MKAKDLIDQLQRLDPESDVGIAPMGGMSGTFASVNNVLSGFDWYSGRILLNTDPQLTIFEWYNRQRKEIDELVRRFCWPESERLSLTTPPIEILKERLISR